MKTPREYLAKIGRKGGEAGTGEAKRRKTTFTPQLAREAAQKRWGNYHPKSNGK